MGRSIQGCSRCSIGWARLPRLSRVPRGCIRGSCQREILPPGADRPGDALRREQLGADLYGGGPCQRLFRRAEFNGCLAALPAIAGVVGERSRPRPSHGGSDARQVGSVLRQKRRSGEGPSGIGVLGCYSGAFSGRGAVAPRRKMPFREAVASRRGAV
jgi:hypothetical protein